MKLSDFLADMQDSGKVVVKAKDLRKYAQQCLYWERAIRCQDDVIKKLMDKIDRLEEKLVLKEIEEPLEIDLFA